MPSKVQNGARLMALAAMAQLVGSIDFLFANFSESFLERGITTAEVGVTKAQIRDFSPDLLEYISHLHIAVAGLGMGLALAGAGLAWFGVQRGLAWAWWTALAAVLVAALVALPAHFVYGLATFGHLGPAFAALAVFALGAALSYPKEKR
jgi:hypothetical protein